MKLSKTTTITYEVCPIGGSYYCVDDNNVIIKLDESDLEDFDIVDEESEDLIHNKLYFEIVDDSQIMDSDLIPIFISDDILQIVDSDNETGEIKNSILLLITEKEIVIIYLGEPNLFDKVIESVKKLRGDRKILYANYVSAE